MHIWFFKWVMMKYTFFFLTVSCLSEAYSVHLFKHTMKCSDVSSGNKMQANMNPRSLIQHRFTCQYYFLFDFLICFHFFVSYVVLCSVSVCVLYVFSNGSIIPTPSELGMSLQSQRTFIFMCLIFYISLWLFITLCSVQYCSLY